MDAELIKNALATARNSLSTYGQHPIIEKQIDKAMEEVDKIEAKSKEVGEKEFERGKKEGMRSANLRYGPFKPRFKG